MSLNKDQIDKIMDRLAKDEHWGALTPEVQSECLQNWQHERAEDILNGIVVDVENESKKKTRRRKTKKDESDGNQTQ